MVKCYFVNESVQMLAVAAMADMERTWCRGHGSLEAGTLGDLRAIDIGPNELSFLQNPCDMVPSARINHASASERVIRSKFLPGVESEGSIG